MIRPEHIEIRTSFQPAATNLIRVTVQEVLNVGDRIKVVASTPGGIELIARRQREAVEESEVRPGQEVAFAFSSDAAHVYPTEPTSTKEVALDS